MKITSQQRDILEFIDMFKRKYNNNPNQVEVAEYFNVTKPAMNIRLKRLRQLNLVDFETKRRSLELTKTGKLLIEST